MLKELVLKDFKSFREETVRFSSSGLTVLVGPNGSGKSSVLEAAIYAAFSHFPALPSRPGAGFVRAGSPSFGLRLVVDAHQVVPDSRVVIEVGFDGKRSVTEWAERVGLWRHVKWDDSRREPPGTASVEANRVFGEVPFPRFFDVDLRRLREPLRPQGLEVVNFGEEQVVQSVFDLKMGSDTAAFNTLIAKLQHVVPAVKGFSIQRQPDGDKDRYRLSFAMTTGADINAEQVSEGTLLTLAVLSAAEHRAARTLLLIDDIDRALHPTAQRELIKLLRAIVKEGNLEIVCTTHSPYILSEFQYDEVRVLKEIDGASRCMSLSDGPEAQRWMKELDAGEYWSFIEHRLFQKSA